MGRRREGDRGTEVFEEMAGKTVHSAREVVAEALRASGDLDGEPQKTQRKANFYERGEKPLEIVTSRQWYIRNGGRDVELNEALQARGDEIDFHPPSCAPLQELGGRAQRRLAREPSALLRGADPRLVPPRPSGEPDYDAPIAPAEDTLPVDPAAQTPPGYTEDQRDQPGGFTGDPDVMDTWATSSLTRRSPATGAAPRPGRATSSARSSPWTRPQGTTSSAPGSSRPSCARTSSTAACRGPTPRSAAGSSTPSARR